MKKTLLSRRIEIQVAGAAGRALCGPPVDAEPRVQVEFPIATAMSRGIESSAVSTISDADASKNRRPTRPHVPPVMCWIIRNASDPSGIIAQ